MEIMLLGKRVLSILIMSLFLVGCGSSDSSSETTEDTVDTADESDVTDIEDVTGTVEITGTVRYQRVPFSNVSGLDYNNIETLPVRGATLYAADSDGNVLVSTTTSETGTYSITVDQNTLVSIVVLAETISTGTAKWNFQVRDNTSDDSLYGMQGSLSSTSGSDEIRNLTAETEWDGSSYTNRSGAPFALLDTTYDVVQKIVAVDPDVEMDDADIFWSENNIAASGDIADGDIGTSYYSNDEVYILGSENSDTDEFDEHVVIHELGHYVEDNLSRSDSTGGSHSLGAVIDMRLALGEGFGNAFSGMVTDDPVYRDSYGSSQARDFQVDVDNNDNTNPGWFSEGSVQSILYDLYDSDVDSDGSDNVALGFTGIYEAMTSSDYIDQSSMTSIFSIIDEIKSQNPSSSTVIDNLVAAHISDSSYGIDTITDKYGTGETHDAGTPTTLDVYKTITDDGVAVEVCSDNSHQEFNGLGTRQFLRLSVTTAGRIDLTATYSSSSSVTSTESVPYILVYKDGTYIGGIAGTSGTATNTMTGAVADEYILEVLEYLNVDSDSSTGGSVCFDVTVTNS